MVCLCYLSNWGSWLATFLWIAFSIRNYQMLTTWVLLFIIKSRCVLWGKTPLTQLVVWIIPSQWSSNSFTWFPLCHLTCSIRRVNYLIIICLLCGNFTIFGSKITWWLLRTIGTGFVSQLIFLLCTIILLINLKRLLAICRLSTIKRAGKLISIISLWFHFFLGYGVVRTVNGLSMLTDESLLRSH